MCLPGPIYLMLSIWNNFRKKSLLCEKIVAKILQISKKPLYLHPQNGNNRGALLK